MRPLSFLRVVHCVRILWAIRRKEIHHALKARNPCAQAYPIFNVDGNDQRWDQSHSLSYIVVAPNDKVGSPSASSVQMGLYLSLSLFPSLHHLTPTFALERTGPAKVAYLNVVPARYQRQSALCGIQSVIKGLKSRT
jgi:hypothetical protein